MKDQAQSRSYGQPELWGPAERATRRAGALAADAGGGKLTNVMGSDDGSMQRGGFRFVDLFAGVGGFHATLTALGGTCVFASEIDREAAEVYKRNWRHQVAGDIVPLTEGRMEVPEHDVLAAGFPCQPFSKSGFQRGMAETRGTLFGNIARVLEVRRPALVLLENVRNLAGPRHRDTWATIVTTLRELGYRVSGTPTVFSPHLLPPDRGGRPQIRDRVFITATYVGRERAEAEASDEPSLLYRPVETVDGEVWDPQRWDLVKHLPLSDDTQIAEVSRYRLSAEETRWINIWDDFVQVLRSRMPRLPGFPIWADEFVLEPAIDASTPAWKVNFLQKNSDLYREHRGAIDAWLARHNYLAGLPASRRKLEWQAQDSESLWSTILHLRPSGIRAKKPTYAPALVAITQTSIVGERKRRITPREAARMQGLPDWFDFGAQPDAASYKQMGNGVNVGAAYHVFRKHVIDNAEDVESRAPNVFAAVRGSDPNPDFYWTKGEDHAPHSIREEPADYPLI